MTKETRGAGCERGLPQLANDLAGQGEGEAALQHLTENKSSASRTVRTHERTVDTEALLSRKTHGDQGVPLTTSDSTCNVPRARRDYYCSR